MAMMSTGSFGHGSSSSSSSTLSPLAQPFTVNRSAPNPKTSPPLRPFIDNYIPSHSSNPTLLSDPFPHLNRDVGCAQDYSYFGSQSIGSCGTHLPSLSPNTHDFLYGQHSDSAGNNVIEVDPYYMQYQPASHDANSSAMQEPGYVFLNSGTSAPLEVSSQANYIQNSTGFGCAPKWTGQWKDVDASLSWKEPKGKVDFPYGSSFQLGAPTTEGFMSYEEGPSVWHESIVESSARKVNIGSTVIGPERIDAIHSAISEVNASIPSFNMCGPSVLVPSTMQEAAYSHIPDSSALVPSTVEETMYSHIPDPFFRNSWNPFNQNTASYDGCFTPLDSCTMEPTIFYPSTAVPTIFCSSATTQPVPSASGSSSLLGKVGLQDVKFCNQPMDGFGKKESVGQVAVKVKVPTATLIADASKNKNEMGKYDHISIESSLVKGLPLNQKATGNSSPSDLSKNEIELQLTQLKIQEASTHAPCIDGLGDSVQSSDALDEFVSAVDSPCWKGTSSRHSPFTVVDAEPLITLAKGPEGYGELSQHNQILSVSADGVEAVSFPEPCGSFNNHGTRGVENSSLTMIHPSVVCSLPMSLELNDAGEKAESDSFKTVNKNEAQCSGGFLNAGNSYVLSNNPSCNSGRKTSNVMPSSHEDVSSAMKPMPQIRNKDPGMDFNAFLDCSSDFRSHKEHASNPSNKDRVPIEADEIFRASDMSNQHSVTRSDVSILVQTIYNLSEVLRSGHYSYANALKENDCEVICHAINNLVGLVGQFPKLIPEVGSSYCIRESIDPFEGTNSGSHLATEVESDDGPSLGGHQSTLCREGIMHSYFCRSCKKVNKIGVVARSDEIDFDKDVRVIQAVKEVINENIPEKGDNRPQTLLFKNLWIEAEAALCSIKYELQLARMQIEMEKSKQHQTKATEFHTSSIAAGKTLDVKKFLSPDAAGRIDWKEQSASEANKCPTGVTTNKSGNSNAPEVNRSDSDVQAEDGDFSLTSNKLAPQKFILVGKNALGQGDRVSSPGCLEGKFDVGMKENKMTTNKVAQHKFILVGKNALGQGDRVSSPAYLEGKFDVGMKESKMKATNPSSVEVKKQRLSIPNQLEVTYRNKSDMQHLGDTSGLDASEKCRMAIGSLIHFSDEASTQPCVPDRLGNWWLQ